MVGGGGQLKLHDPVRVGTFSQLLLAGGGRSLATCSPIRVRAGTVQNENIFADTNGETQLLGTKGHAANYDCDNLWHCFAQLVAPI